MLKRPRAPHLRGMAFASAACGAARARPAARRLRQVRACAATPPVPSRAPSRAYSLAAASEMLARAGARARAEDGTAERLEALARLLVVEGQRTNLSAVRCVPGALVTHIVDSLSLLPALDAAGARTVVDVGSGAGFPGLVLAIARPAWSVTLVEAARKKVDFQRAAADALAVPNAAPTWGRAEDLARPGGPHRATFDAAVARAVAHMPVLAELALPLVRNGGVLVAQKSLDHGHTEIVAGKRAVALLGGKVRDVREAWTEQIVREVAAEFGEQRDSTDDRRKCLILVDKIGGTSENFPRMYNAIKKKPL